MQTRTVSLNDLHQHCMDLTYLACKKNEHVFPYYGPGLDAVSKVFSGKNTRAMTKTVMEVAYSTSKVIDLERAIALLNDALNSPLNDNKPRSRFCIFKVTSNAENLKRCKAKLQDLLSLELRADEAKARIYPNYHADVKTHTISFK